MKSKDDVRAKLIAAGVKNLREFGYPDVNDKNILTDIIYSAFFKQMLKDNIGKGLDVPITSLLEEMKK